MTPPRAALLSIRFPPDFESWRRIARPLLARRIRPAEIRWRPQLAAGSPGRQALLGTDETRWDFLYRIAYRLTVGEAALMDEGADADLAGAESTSLRGGRGVA